MTSWRNKYGSHYFWNVQFTLKLTTLSITDVSRRPTTWNKYLKKLDHLSELNSYAHTCLKLNERIFKKFCTRLIDCAVARSLSPRTCMSVLSSTLRGDAILKCLFQVAESSNRTCKRHVVDFHVEENESGHHNCTPIYVIRVYNWSGNHRSFNSTSPK